MTGSIAVDLNCMNSSHAVKFFHTIIENKIYFILVQMLVVIIVSGNRNLTLQTPKLTVLIMAVTFALCFIAVHNMSPYLLHDFSSQNKVKQSIADF